MVNRRANVLIDQGFNGNEFYAKIKIGGAKNEVTLKEKNNKLTLVFSGDLDKAIASGGNIIACNMSMDLMGIHEDELMDGVSLAGVATYLAEGEESDINMFI